MKVETLTEEENLVLSALILICETLETDTIDDGKIRIKVNVAAKPN